ncbi:glycosyltransferase family 39 protein [Nocardioides donggukensis]|uniref:Glycosyltransferase family 39 protein n=1 Tax=Nocardioides donggukensis TaxID=2774019 RepID=A0A927K6E1_9ACTN|nr:glycosyltransferase family 39 protein [Nocardioides donggukensis]MBD8868555.1 glycosyltransferase family 39 protein [Nocardioides donggukensis]
MTLPLRDPTTRVVAAAAVAAFLLRFPGSLWPVRPDEAGFTLVARAWSPQPDSLYGPYFVDRPPLLIGLVRLCDDLGGPLLLRFVAALGCLVAVISAAGVARLVAGPRTAGWTAVATAAVVANTMIDSVAAKGEVLGIPVILTSIWFSLLALERRSPGWAAAAGLLAATVLGLKQNLVGGLVFGGVLLVAALLTRALSGREFARLGAAAAAGAAVPVLGTVLWTVLAGVDLDVLWYAVLGFRSDATGVLVTGETGAPAHRAAALAGVVLICGIALIIGGFLAHLPGEWSANPPVAAATLALILTDGIGLVLSGSFWRPYAFALVPATALCAALLLRRRSKRGLAMRSVIVVAAVSSLLSVVGWTALTLTGSQPPGAVYTGEAVADAAEPGDTLVVFGGRADLQFASGLDSPYEYVWSLPMRTLDPEYAELRALVSGDRAPTWLVEWVDFTTWDEPAGSALADVVQQHYRVGGFACDGRPIWVQVDAVRPFVTVDCDRPPVGPGL